MDELREAQREMMEKWPSREDHPRWDQYSALTLCKALRSPASQAGWLLCLYGSALSQKDAGDLDLMFVNWRANPSKTTVVKWLRENYHAKVVDHYRGIMGVGVGMCTKDGHLLDLYFRITDVELEASRAHDELQA